MSALVRLLALMYGQRLAFIYGRLATIGPEDGDALARQLKLLTRRAERLGFQTRDDLIVGEVGSGLNPNLPGLLRLRRSIRDREVQAVFVRDESRFSRDLALCAEIIAECKAAGVEIHCFDGRSRPGRTG